MSQRRLTCAGGGVAFTQFLCQLGHLAAYRFVAAHESIFRDGVILGSPERPVIILLKKGGRREMDNEKAATCCVSNCTVTGVGLLEYENLVKKRSHALQQG